MLFDNDTTILYSGVLYDHMSLAVFGAIHIIVFYIDTRSLELVYIIVCTTRYFYMYYV